MQECDRSEVEKDRLRADVQFINWIEFFGQMVVTAVGKVEGEVSNVKPLLLLGK